MDVNCERLFENLHTLGSIGYKKEKGVFRMAYTKAFCQGREYVQQLMEAAGMDTYIDAVGNLTGILTPTAEKPCTKRIAMGSHIDTVPGGGIYDGALGVISAIEIIRTLRENGYRNRHPIEVIAFNEEEGNVIGGTFGSKAFSGVKIENAMIPLMRENHITESNVQSCRRNAQDYQAYLEYHIEQGGILEYEKRTIGIVQGIFGILRYKAIMTGEANHAGSTPMYLRNDALVKSCYFITELMEKVQKTGKTMVCTVGTISVSPGAVNVIPGKVEFIIEIRNKSLNEMYQVISELREEWGEKGLVLEEYITQKETKCDNDLNQIIKDVADELGYTNMKMYSGAGHDLINMSFMVPSALIFIPSRKGLSHHKDEYSSTKDIRAGAQVLLKTLVKIDGGSL